MARQRDLGYEKDMWFITLRHAPIWHEQDHYADGELIPENYRSTVIRMGGGGRMRKPRRRDPNGE